MKDLGGRARWSLAGAAVQRWAGLPLAITTVSVTPAHAALVNEPLLLGGGTAVIAAAIAGFSLLRLARFKKQLQFAQKKWSELETALNTAEAALQAETQLLVVWNGSAAEPERLIGSMHGTVAMPNTLAGLMEFEDWLEHDSAAALTFSLSDLRQSGNPFNRGLKTRQGELLEADGRTAGGLATLRFRPLSGERREKSETLYGAHKLAKQVERLSALLDSVPFPVWISGNDGNLNWVNKSYVEATEAVDSESVIKSNISLYRGDAIDRSKAEPKSGVIGRARAIQAGKIHALNIYEVQLPSYRAGFAVDVTPLEQAERELERHIKAHDSTLDKLSTAIAIFGPDQKLRFFNHAYLELWELDEAWLKSQPSDGEILDRLRSQRRLPEEANYREWRSRQLAAYSDLESREAFWYLPDGKSLRVICEQHPFGGVTYLYENLTREYQLESRYNELFDVQRETLDNLAEAVALSGSDGRLRLFNPAFMRFWSLDANFLSNKPHVEELAQLPGLSADARAAWQDIKFGLTGIEANRKSHEGRIAQDNRFLRYRAVPLPDGNALLTFTDVSDAVKIEQALRDRTDALEAADRLKNTLLANVSYEVRTPLTSIVGFAETLEYGLAGPLTAKQREYVGDIRKSSLDLKAIIDAIIDLSAIDAGQMELRLESFDIATLLQETAGDFIDALALRNQKLTIEISDDVGSMVGEQSRLRKVFGQLLSNASGFSAPGGIIRLGARLQGESVQIWVADTGRGIEPELQPRVFERFQSKPFAGGHRGPGLGLAIVKSFTELHGGKVSLVSKLDLGTTVVCTLPLAGPRKKDLTLPQRTTHFAA